MKYLKLFETFDVVMPEKAKNIVSEWGLTMDDIEELFLEFSDMGYDIQINPYILRGNRLAVNIRGLSEDESYSPEISRMFRQIIRRSNELGLHTIASTDSQVKYGYDKKEFIQFIFNKL